MKDGQEFWEVHINGGRIGTGLEAVAWAREVERLGAGEIVLTSMDADGTKDGYDLEITAAVTEAVTIPVVASGGAGCPEHLADAILLGGADAALAASIFHFGEYTIRRNQASHARPGNSGAVAVELRRRAIVHALAFDPAFSRRRQRRLAMAIVTIEATKTRFLGKHKELEIDKLFRALVKLEGSDLHLKVGLPPYVRVNGTLRPLNRGPIDDEEMVRLIFPMIERAEPQADLRRGRRRRLRLHRSRSTASAGGSA